MKDDLLTIEETSELLGISIPTLYRWRAKGTGPNYIKFGGRILYEKASLQNWYNSQRVQHDDGE